MNNLAAFLNMIAFAEGTLKAADPYRVCFGYKHTIASFADHPAVTREWMGERLPDAICRGAGMQPGCVSTAAGKYQIIRPTWVACKRALKLTDFSPASQDAAATQLITQRGALEDIKMGRIAKAIEKVRSEWASLPGAGYAQPERSIAALTAAFVKAGGNVA
jgi:lysozyme